MYGHASANLYPHAPPRRPTFQWHSWCYWWSIKPCISAKENQLTLRRRFQTRVSLLCYSMQDWRVTGPWSWRPKGRMRLPAQTGLPGGGSP